MSDIEIKILDKLLKSGPCSIDEFQFDKKIVIDDAISNLYCDDLIGFVPGNTNMYRIANITKASRIVSSYKSDRRNKIFDRIIAILTLAAAIFGIALQLM